MDTIYAQQGVVDAKVELTLCCAFPLFGVGPPSKCVIVTDESSEFVNLPWVDDEIYTFPSEVLSVLGVRYVEAPGDYWKTMMYSEAGKIGGFYFPHGLCDLLRKTGKTQMDDLTEAQVDASMNSAGTDIDDMKQTRFRLLKESYCQLDRLPWETETESRDRIVRLMYEITNRELKRKIPDTVSEEEKLEEVEKSVPNKRKRAQIDGPSDENVTEADKELHKLLYCLDIDAAKILDLLQNGDVHLQCRVKSSNGGSFLHWIVLHATEENKILDGVWKHNPDFGLRNQFGRTCFAEAFCSGDYKKALWFMGEIRKHQGEDKLRELLNTPDHDRCLPIENTIIYFNSNDGSNWPALKDAVIAAGGEYNISVLEYYAQDNNSFWCDL